MLKKLLVLLAALYASLAFAAADVNSATAADLDAVKGIGPALSARIIDARTQGGAFKDWNDLLARVKGIGEKSAAKLSTEGLTVNGSTYPGAPAKAAPAVRSGAAAVVPPAAATASPAATRATLPSIQTKPAAPAATPALPAKPAAAAATRPAVGASAAATATKPAARASAAK